MPPARIINETRKENLECSSMPTDSELISVMAKLKWEKKDNIYMLINDEFKKSVYYELFRCEPEYEPDQPTQYHLVVHRLTQKFLNKFKEYKSYNLSDMIYRDSSKKKMTYNYYR